MDRRTLLAMVAGGFTFSSGCVSSQSKESKRLVEVQNRTKETKNIGILIINTNKQMLFNHSYRLGAESIQTSHFSGNPDKVLVRYGTEYQRKIDYQSPDNCGKNQKGSISIYIGDSGISARFNCR